jgi:ribonuclease VapC
MVIDTSAILAILQGEPERRRFLEAMEGADLLRMSVASFVECSMVIGSRYGGEGVRDLDQLISRAGIQLTVDHEQALLARSHSAAFGKGRRSRRTQLWRLFRVCSGHGISRAAAVQGRRLRSYGRSGF